jgi:trehalose/maltose hydrolase-like predicted phosphorylase
VAQQNHSGCHFNSDVTAQALSDFEFVWKSRDELLDTHTAAWLKLWDSRIEIEGMPALCLLSCAASAHALPQSLRRPQATRSWRGW